MSARFARLLPSLWRTQGLDLREYAKTIERELVQVERASVDDCASDGTTHAIVARPAKC